MLEALTDLGDATLILPTAVLLIIYLWFSGARRAALAWGATLSLCIVLVLVFKIGFGACSESLAALDIRSPSGHAALAVTLYGCGARLLGGGQSRWFRIGIGLFAGALVAAIAISRVALHLHNPAEIVAGLAIGLVCLATFSMLNPDVKRVRVPSRPALGLFVLLAVLSHGRHLSAELWVAQISRAADICTAATPIPRLGLTAHSS
jgi:membrane-associated phospholipid phosphatase